MHATINAEGGPNKSSREESPTGGRGTPRAVLGHVFLACILFVLIAAGCSGDCLPAPASDVSPPDLRVVVEYQTTAGGELTRREVSAADSSVTLRADRNSPVQILYAGEDSSGLRRLVPGLTIHHTVGIGVERRHVELGPVDASCPLPRLDRRHEVHGTGAKRVLIITAGAENWSGMRTSIQPISVRLE